MQTEENTTLRRNIPVLLILGFIFIAANLRAPITAVGPLIGLIQENLHISGTEAGFITTLPLFAFAVFSPIVPWLSRKFGMNLVLFCSVLVLTTGIIVRSSYSSLGLFIGTAVLGLAIAVGNVLLPGLIKKEFPTSTGVMTGVYTLSMNIFAALSSGISLPLALHSGLGWEGSLRIWAVLGSVAVVLWLPQLFKKKKLASTLSGQSKESEAPLNNKAGVWSSALAWQVSIYMGLQSTVFYSMVAWLPTILVQQGMDSTSAGWTLSLMQMAIIPMTFIGALLAGRYNDQITLVIVGSLFVMSGIGGLLLVHNSVMTYIWVILLGIGGGITFGLAMMFFTLRTKTAYNASELSGMGQSVGYLLAACGPLFFGYVHDVTASWTLPLIFLLGVAAVCLITGLGAGRKRYVENI